jgi:ferric-dicitrate binding protein FerR (iron transport regulator)
VSGIRPPNAYGVRVPNSDDEDLERLLRNARPAPRPGYTRELKDSLPLPRRRKPSARNRLAVAAIGVIAAIALVTLVAAFAGVRV